MKRRILAGLLAAALAFPAAPALADAAEVPMREKAVVLQELEIMVGDETGDLGLERQVTRAEFTKLAVAASPSRDSVGTTAATDPYPDVSHRDWFAPYVRLAVDLGLVEGDLEGYFHPQRTITLQEGATMAVRLLGYGDSDFSAPWPAGQMALYRSLKLDAGVAAQKGGELLTRRDCLHLFYNLLTVNTKGGTPYLNLLGHTLNQDGEVDVAALFQVEREGPIPLTGAWEDVLPFDVADALLYRDNKRVQREELEEWDLLYWAKDQAIVLASSDGQAAMSQVTATVEGPVVAEGTWKSKLPFDPGQAEHVTRNGYAATPADIQAGDVVYWSKYTKALYVTGKTVWGTVESISPSLAAPTSVTVAGNSYSLETFEAQYAFSDLGQFHRGDRVTLLLGRTGGVAAVRPLAENASAAIGVVFALEEKPYTDGNDDSYTQKVITLVTPEGERRIYPYPWRNSDDLSPGDLVSVTLNDQGSATVARLEKRPLTGTVNADATQLGKFRLAPDAAILETYPDSALTATVHRSRLAGVRFSGNMVRYYQTNEEGVITALLLDDVTGDSRTYGILTDLATTQAPVSMGRPGMILQSTYTILDTRGQERSIPVMNRAFPVSKGPCQMVTNGSEVKSIRNLTQVKNVTLTGVTALAGETRCTLADQVAYYRYNKSDGTYTLASRSLALEPGYTLSAWYDEPDSAGGRVRIVVAEKL